jgi:uncharacterized protein YjbJ (UPF0337 family)
MGITDKITGRAKQAAGDLMGDRDTARQGETEERKSEAKEDLAKTQDQADRKAEEVSNLEHRS